MEKTVGEIRDNEKGTEYGAMLDRVDAETRRHTGEGIRKFKVKSAEVMGEAGGMFETGSEEKSYREDVLRDEKLAIHVGVHENLHDLGVDCDGGDHCLMDGFVELKTSKLLGDEPVEAYRGLVRAAQHVVDVVGDEAFELASQGAQSQALLTTAYIRAKLENVAVAANDDVETYMMGIESVSREAEEAVAATLAA